MSVKLVCLVIFAFLALETSALDKLYITKKNGEKLSDIIMNLCGYDSNLVNVANANRIRPSDPIKRGKFLKINCGPKPIPTTTAKVDIAQQTTTTATDAKTVIIKLANSQQTTAKPTTTAQQTTTPKPTTTTPKPTTTTPKPTTTTPKPTTTTPKPTTTTPKPTTTTPKPTTTTTVQSGPKITYQDYEGHFNDSPIADDSNADNAKSEDQCKAACTKNENCHGLQFKDGKCSMFDATLWLRVTAGESKVYIKLIDGDSGLSPRQID